MSNIKKIIFAIVSFLFILNSYVFIFLFSVENEVDSVSSIKYFFLFITITSVILAGKFISFIIYPSNKKDKDDIDNKLTQIDNVAKNKVLQKKKQFGIKITFYDNTVKFLFSKDYRDLNETYITFYCDFYKWFFCRDNSQVYVFEHRDGAYVFYKKDIKYIDFTDKIVEVEVDNANSINKGNK